MKAGVAVDDWKLPVFRKLLSEAGFEFTECPGLTGWHVIFDGRYT